MTDTKIKKAGLFTSTVKLSFKIYQSNFAFYLENLLTKKILKIDTTTFKTDTCNRKTLEESPILKTRIVQSFLGVIDILGQPHFLVVTKQDLVLKLIEKEIYQIHEVELIGATASNTNQKISDDIQEIKARICKVMTSGFYYSFGFDLSNKLQNQEKNLKTMTLAYTADVNSMKYFLKYQELNNYFFYNKNMIKPLINDSTSEGVIMQWTPVLLYGDIRVKQFPSMNLLKNKEINMLIISRRSCLSPSKFTGKQGLTEDFQVTNFIETEQILFSYNQRSNNYVLNSTIQASSSPPIFYSVNENKVLSIYKHPNSSKLQYSKFVESVSDAYKQTLIVNTIPSKSTDDQLILQSLEKIISFNNSHNSDYLRYFYYDYPSENLENSNSEVSNLSDKQIIHEDNVQLDNQKKRIIERELLSDIGPVINYFKCFQYDNMVSFSTENQSGVFYYLNTKDLRKSGVIETIVGFHSLVGALKNFGIKIDLNNPSYNRLNYLFEEKEGKENELNYKKSDLSIETEEEPVILVSSKSENKEQSKSPLLIYEEDIKTLKTLFLDLWVESRRVLSHQYLSTINFEEIEKEYQGIAEISNPSYNLKIQSIILKILSGEQRFYTEEEYTHRLSTMVFANNHLYSEEKKIRIHCNTFNTGAKEPKENAEELKALFSPYKDANGTHKQKLTLPDVFVFGYQEICDLNAMNIFLLSNSNAVQSWKEFLENQLSELKPDEYKLIHQSDLVGICLFVFARKPIIDNISNMDSEILRLGLKGLLGNKGSLIFRFDYYLTSFAVVCSHLEAGPKKMKERLEQMKMALSSELFISKEEFDSYKTEITKHDNFMELLKTYRDSKKFQKVKTYTAKNNLKRFNSINVTFHNTGTSLKDEEKETKKESHIDEAIFKQKVYEHDVVFFLGDLNFRVDMKYEDCVQSIKEGKIEEVLKEDQYKKSAVVYDMIEGAINFPPTYKFNLNSLDYTVKKMRTPSWCDRVLFKNSHSVKNQVEILDYNWVPTVGSSDHKPVYCILDVKAYKENVQKRKSYQEEISKKLKYLLEEDLGASLVQSDMVEDNDISFNYKLCMELDLATVHNRSNTVNFKEKKKNYPKQTTFTESKAPKLDESSSNTTEISNTSKDKVAALRKVRTMSSNYK